MSKYSMLKPPSRGICTSFLLITLAFFVCLLFHSNEIVLADTDNPIPSVPKARTDRFGIYNWGVDYEAHKESDGDRLNWAADKVASLGSRTIRITMPGIFYNVGPSGKPKLAQTAASDAYDRLFSDPRFRTYLITAYSWEDMRGQWADGYSEEEYNTTRNEIAELGDYLLSNPRYAGKTFIILNWEGDNAMFWYSNKQTIWDSYTAWIQSRADGVKDARRHHSASTARFFSGLEFNTVRSLKTGQACGTAVADPLGADPLKNRCVIDYVAPKVDVDYYSYSAWLSLDVKINQGANASLKDAIKSDLNFALSQVKAGHPEAIEANFIIGEFGFPRTRWGETTVANFTKEFFDALEAPDAFKVSYAIFWQIIDNMRMPFVVEDGFGLFKSRDGQLVISRAGEVFRQRLMDGGMPLYTDNPSISKGPIPGIVDAESGLASFRLNPDSLLAIYAPDKSLKTAFSREGNQVIFQQGINYHMIPRDNPALFFESESRINAALPYDRRPGWAAVTVTNKNGIDSNAQFIKLECKDCPEIRSNGGVLDGITYLEEFQPSSIISIFGYKFSAKGNTVTVRQIDDRNKIRSFTLERDAVWYESPNQINVRLPAELVTRNYATVTVTNAEGLESNEYSIYVKPDCQDCLPTIRPYVGIISRDTNDDTFYVDSIVTVFGSRFSSQGNRLVVEQAGRKLIAQINSQWNESPTQITAQLPSEIVPGHSLVYVVDAAGRESNATEIYIQRAIQRKRTPLRRSFVRSTIE